MANRGCVKFTFTKIDQSYISLTYQPFDNAHSQLWLRGIREFVDSNQILVDKDRVYNFNDYSTELQKILKNCNDSICLLNKKYKLKIPDIRIDHLQEDVNYVHTFFVDSERNKINDVLWSKLNELLHGLEIIQRSKTKELQGQVFVCLPNNKRFDIAQDSYRYFTTKKKFGYCYANYPHIGRHIFEMFNAQDETANDEDIIPMSKISGDSYLWFGKDTPWIYYLKRQWDIRRWFLDRKINKIVNMNWGDPRLAIGWLPVAEITQSISREALIGLSKLEKIEIV